jgi:hypothetical protein
MTSDGVQTPNVLGNAVSYPFFSTFARSLNAGVSRSILLSGEIHDLFYSEKTANYVPLLDFLTDRCQIPGLFLLVYELNGPVRLITSGGTCGGDAAWLKLQAAWVAWKLNTSPEELVLQSLTQKKFASQRDALMAEFETNVTDIVGRPTFALEFLRQLTLCSRTLNPAGKNYLDENLLIFIEAADMAVPAGNGNIASLSSPDRHRVSILHDWLSDPGFVNGDDSVVLLCESASLMHPRISQLPSVLSIQVDAPNLAQREHYIHWFMNQLKTQGKPEIKLWASVHDLSRFSAGLSLHALRQLLVSSAHTQVKLMPVDVIIKVEAHICSQLGEDVIEFKKPTHSLEDVIGFKLLKQFIADELIPRFKSEGEDALPGAAVAGPIGGGKTFIFEAVASALDLPVLVLKNIRSQWFGQTDVIFERLRRVLTALDKVVIFVDEADTQFGSLGPNTHDTEKRLTGKIQQMMSDTSLRGRVIWLLMTARIHRLSPDIRRPGRIGDLIIPVLDPEGEDHYAFCKWVLLKVLPTDEVPAALDPMAKLTEGYSAAAFAALRSRLKAAAGKEPLTFEKIRAIVHDLIPPAIEDTRRYQTLQALVNCTRRSLLPDPEVDLKIRSAWQTEIRALELRGIS